MPTEYRIPIQAEINVLKQEGNAQSPTPAQDPNIPQLPSNASTQSIVENTQNSVVKTMAVQMGRQALQYALSNYGNLTGDYVGQSNISAGIEIGSLALMTITGGAVGALAAIGALTVKNLNYYLDVKKSENQARAMRERVGLL